MRSDIDVSLDRRFSIDRQNACAGRFEEPTPILSPRSRAGMRPGWAWDGRAGRPPRLIVLGSAGDRVPACGGRSHFRPLADAGPV